MKPGTNEKLLKENGNPDINQSPAARLSEDAFYLIALIHLLKKESGESIIYQSLHIVSNSVRNDNIRYK